MRQAIKNAEVEGHGARHRRPREQWEEMQGGKSTNTRLHYQTLSRAGNLLDLRSAVTVLKFLIIFEKVALHPHHAKWLTCTILYNLCKSMTYHSDFMGEQTATWGGEVLCRSDTPRRSGEARN